MPELAPEFLFDKLDEFLLEFEQHDQEIKAGVAVVGDAAAYALVWEWGNTRQSKPGPKKAAVSTAEPAPKKAPGKTVKTKPAERKPDRKKTLPAAAAPAAVKEAPVRHAKPDPGAKPAPKARSASTPVSTANAISALFREQVKAARSHEPVPAPKKAKSGGKKNGKAKRKDR